MSTATVSSSLCSSEEKTNGFKLMRLIIDGGTEALRNVFKTKHPGDLQTVLGTYHSTLQPLKNRNIITPPQWVKLYPPGPVIPNIKEFDITLLFLLLRNICGISAPIGTGWNNMPSNTNTSLEANIVRIKLFRNKFFGHIPDTAISTTEFEDHWGEVSTTLVDLGISKVEIDQLKDEECGEEEVDRITREWRENVTLELEKFKENLTEHDEILLDLLSEAKCTKSDQHDILNKHLNCCDFSRNIELLYQKWCKDTREWVFNQVSEWFNDIASDNRAFIIAGQPGMGKSVIAAVICRRFAGKLAACHFCQYNNDRYNNPKILLQSLAKQLSDVVPEYKKTIEEKLSGKEGQRLEDMNIQGLFSVLFKEPLTGIDVEEKYLVVIDGVDESEREGKSDLVDLIADYLGQLPSFIRFVITTRPENDISKKFEKLNSLFLSTNDEQNVKDIQRLFEKKLSPAKAKHIRSLIDKSEGLMLFANYLLEIINDCSFDFDIDDLPTGIEGIYKSYFKRWEKEFHYVEVQAEEFLSFLSIMAVAKEPLPETLVAKVFDSKNISPVIAKRKMHTIKNCLSLLLVIQQDRLTFFHKSVKEWLVQSDHEFQVDEKFGHKTLANICAREMDELKKKELKPPFHSAAEYALLYGLQHELAGAQDEPIKFFINTYVTDLEIMYASISVDVYTTFKNIRTLKKDIIYSNVPEETRRTVETLMLLIRKYRNTFQDFPQSFLQHVLNWGDEELSLKAASLLNYRYKDLVYFEHREKDSLENSLVSRICTSAIIVGLAVSPSEDYLVCWYDDGRIELFSIQDFQSLWTIENADLAPLTDSSKGEVFNSIIAFHPRKNIILPARLDCVISLQGKFEPGPFSCNDINSLFENCCFSNDSSKMATTFGNGLNIWNLINDDSLQSFSSDYVLLSVSFSANGRFLATSDEGKRVVVYDLESNYIRISELFLEPIYFLSTFQSDSWYCSTGQADVYTVRPDLSALDPVADGHYSTPLNARATAEFEDFFQNPHFSEDFADEPVKPWFSPPLKESYGFFCLDHDVALVWLNHSWELNFYRISKLKEPQSVRDDFDITEDAVIDISVDGKFIYTAYLDELRLHKLDSTCSIVSSSTVEWSENPFATVTNGVFFYENDIPELWNSDLTRLLGSFQELSDTEECLLVSPELVACIMINQVCFFNVVERKIVSKTSVSQDMEVKACSSKYHVLDVSSLFPSLWRDGKFIAELAGVDSDSLEKCIFSPSSEKLALRFDDDKAVYIFDVGLARFRRKVDFEFLRSIPDEEDILQFLDEDHLLCRAYLSSACIINASSGNAVTCVYISGIPYSLCLSHKQENGSALLCFKTCNKNIKLIKVCFPR